MVFIIQDVIEKMNGVRKNQKKFLVGLLTTILSMIGRVNFRNMSRYSSFSEKTFSRNFAKCIDFLQFNLLAVQRILPSGGRLALAFDPFFIEKSGKSTYGKDSFWNGSNSHAEQGLEASGFAVINVSDNEGYPLHAIQTPNKDEIKQITGMADASRLDFYIHCIITNLPKIRSLFPNIYYFVADAYFAKAKVVAALIGCNFHIVSKLRSDANLRSLVFEKRSGRGRPQKYGKKINVKDLANFQLAYKLCPKITLYEGLFYSINLKREIKVVCVVRYDDKRTTSTSLLFSTDIHMDVLDVYEYYKARFQIEFIYRDAKQFTGLTQCQARTKEKIHNHLNASFTALLVAKVQEVKLRQQTAKKIPFSMASHKRKNLNEMTLNLFIANFDLDPSLIKKHPNLESMLKLGVIR